MSKKVLKKRYWCFVGYPESLPHDWIEILTLTGLQIAISPLHDKDIDPDGQPKKSHYHIILSYEGPTTENAVKQLVCSKLGQPIPIPLDSVRGMYRYFIHRDNPDKYQYDESAIKTINGFSIYDYAELTKMETIKIKRDLQRLIIQMKIFEYADFMELMDSLESDEYYLVASTQTIFFNTFICSRRNKSKSEFSDIHQENIEKNRKKNDLE